MYLIYPIKEHNNNNTGSIFNLRWLQHQRPDRVGPVMQAISGLRGASLHTASDLLKAINSKSIVSFTEVKEEEEEN